MDALPKLRVLGAGGGKSYDLQYGQNVVGKSADCGVHLDLPSLSQQHAIIRVDDDGSVSIEDLKSTNKTMLGSLEEPLELVRTTSPTNHSPPFRNLSCRFFGGYHQKTLAPRLVNSTHPPLA